MLGFYRWSLICLGSKEIKRGLCRYFFMKVLEEKKMEFAVCCVGYLSFLSHDRNKIISLPMDVTFMQCLEISCILNIWIWDLGFGILTDEFDCWSVIINYMLGYVI